MVNNSSVFRVTPDEIDFDSIVGSGAYSTVYKVRMADAASSAAFSIASSSDDDWSCDTRLAAPNSDGLYALKKLHGNCEGGDLGKFAAAEDLLAEAKLLAKLPRHESIVTLHGVSAGFWTAPARGFLLLDFLPESLESRIAKWKESKHRDSQQRVMEVCLPVARALSFLHSHKICYRDLKPENIGFDSEGKVRLYDFGFARKVKSDRLSLKKRIGTPRYMAPEVMKKERYGTPSDVYSFSILVWEIIMLKKPYEKAADFDQLIEMVAEQHVRPSLSMWTMRWSEIKALMSWCWHKDQAQRPGADQIVKELAKACKSALKKQARRASCSGVVDPEKLSVAPRAA